MAKNEDFEEEEDDFEEDEEEVSEKVETRGRPRKEIPAPKVALRTVDRSEESKPSQKGGAVSYTAYHYPEQLGIRNDATSEQIGDLYSILALILTKIQRLEEGLL